MSYSIVLQPSGLRFTAEAGQSLLRAAEDAGVVLPSSCRNGTCRTCLCQVREGEVTHTLEWPGVTREERAEGWILPCVAEARSNAVIDAPLAASFD
ncbi:2Fe-2S iron-sulfur cluster-binding protein [Pseudacidovorax sp. RU35E]|uniref:2Fe-2S iron-sulfur cluster-binding protein n=1 Tax=Pseudacidovorax sp. RU35E TaxID=1907403 RepID=UPI0009542A57|nr:2Fe-2S iron-sulfur cluster-binding protein [Pseudacidovorax sp. RU35E]SIP93665.1 Ferredoxin [Pseudacidovorax sp. RU35E]